MLLQVGKTLLISIFKLGAILILSTIASNTAKSAMNDTSQKFLQMGRMCKSTWDDWRESGQKDNEA